MVHQDLVSIGERSFLVDVIKTIYISNKRWITIAHANS